MSVHNGCRLDALKTIQELVRGRRSKTFTVEELEEAMYKAGMKYSAATLAKNLNQRLAGREARYADQRFIERLPSGKYRYIGPIE